MPGRITARVRISARSPSPTRHCVRWASSRSQIQLDMNDTRNPNSGPSGGSRSNVFSGNAITVACRMLVDAMKKADGSYRTYDEMKAENHSAALRRQVGAPPPARLARSNPPAGQPVPDLHVRHLHRRSGGRPEDLQDEVRQADFGMDVGTIINKVTVDGQNYGGITQGHGSRVNRGLR